MNDDPPVHAGCIVVFHAGALGDVVLTWPLLRAISRQGARPLLIARASHASLTRDFLGATITAMDIEHPDLNALWQGRVAPAWPERADEILSFLADPEDPVGGAWHRAACTLFGASTSSYVPAPGSPARSAVWDRFRVSEFGAVATRNNREGPIVLHVGAGGRSKMWPMARWHTLSDVFRTDGHSVEVLAGEVEADRFTADERSLFAAMGGVYPSSLHDLAARLSSARLYIGADTGPTHLAAQLGVPTLALFGPTDPGVWAPVGPRVRVLAPDVPSPMDVHAVPQVFEEAAAMLTL